jgi:hypothetical protein
LEVKDFFLEPGNFRHGDTGDGNRGGESFQPPLPAFVLETAEQLADSRAPVSARREGREL